MSAIDSYRTMRDSGLRNGERQREEEFQTGQRNALRTAGIAYAGGDNAAASNELAVNGLLPQALQLDNQIRTTANSDIAAGRIDLDRQKATVVAAANGLLELPEDQWMSAITNQIAPAFREVGLGPQLDQALADGQITRQEVTALLVAAGGDAPNPYENDRAGPEGSVLRPGADGSYSPVYTPPVDPLEEEYRRAQIASLNAGAGAREAAAERSRRPAAGRGGGRARSSGGGSARSGGGSPWERYR